MPIRVTAPNRGFTDTINGDRFYRGVCTDASEANLPYYTRQGYLIGDAADLPSAVPPSEEQILTAAATAVKELAEQDAVDAASADGKNQADEPADAQATPKRNAPRAVWASFLTDQGIAVDDGASREELIDAWEQSRA